jgi:hypothetical protein
MFNIISSFVGCSLFLMILIEKIYRFCLPLIREKAGLIKGAQACDIRLQDLSTNQNCMGWCLAQPRKNGATWTSSQHCLDLLPSPESVAVYPQSPYYSPNPNAGIHNTRVVVCNLYCVRSSDLQVSSAQKFFAPAKSVIAGFCRTLLILFSLKVLSLQLIFAQ